MSRTGQTREELLDGVCEYIAAYHAREGIAPTVREIQQFMGVASTSTAYAALTTLKKQGRITMNDHCPRTIRLQTRMAGVSSSRISGDLDTPPTGAHLRCAATDSRRKA